jgi:hypothetical protein
MWEQLGQYFILPSLPLCCSFAAMFGRVRGRRVLDEHKVGAVRRCHCQFFCGKILVGGEWWGVTIASLFRQPILRKKGGHAGLHERSAIV